MNTRLNFKAAPVIAFAVIAMLFISQAVNAQGTGKSVVTLKSGEVIKGTILEAVPEQYIKIELPDKTVKKINSSDISEIANADVKPPAKIGFSLMAGVYAGYDLTSGLDYVIVIPRVVVGLRINEQRVGVGFGFIYGMSQNYNTAVANNTLPAGASQKIYYVPIYLNYHGEFGKKKILPSIDVSIGYAAKTQKNTMTFESYDPNMGTNDYNVNLSQGLAYAEISPGVSFKVAKNFRINVAANVSLFAFQLWQSEEDFIVGSTTDPEYAYPGPKSTTVAVSVGGSLTFIY